MKRIQRSAGAVVGSAVGDALGGPFEFGPRGAFSARFPTPGAGGEMSGGGGWDPGEATDDTQMAVLARTAIDLGGDTDTVAAVTGGLAGAYYGLDAIPARWTESLHVLLPGFDGRVLRLPDLIDLAYHLEG
ncbi:ADP-ribosylglycohydrolase family protein [Streptomyces himalayensis]|uniref:ADP-ribosylglycohydrolase family protein n=1 Tax=Streptomyces himalayensis subsp. himalayensis TaxID=2756131 RepID=A0A7W0DFS2_9ACTN|nr:ADP-ribosylglycohydrolase family protein [Streptomyces himalayensis]MBA2944276.1 ADP-ribosylglycohydrolase family protein [Streptomyces himalayensis subsp. himalayensis]